MGFTLVILRKRQRCPLCVYKSVVLCRREKKGFFCKSVSILFSPHAKRCFFNMCTFSFCTCILTKSDTPYSTFCSVNYGPSNLYKTSKLWKFYCSLLLIGHCFQFLMSVRFLIRTEKTVVNLRIEIAMWWNTTGKTEMF